MEINQTVNEHGHVTKIVVHEGDVIELRMVGKPQGVEGKPGLDSLDDEVLIVRVVGGRGFITSMHSAARCDEQVYEVTQYEIHRSHKDIRDGVMESAGVKARPGGKARASGGKG